MSDPLVCRRCGSDRVIPQVSLRDYGETSAESQPTGAKLGTGRWVGGRRRVDRDLRGRE